jgi:hypothetical protein
MQSKEKAKKVILFRVLEILETKPEGLRRGEIDEEFSFKVEDGVGKLIPQTVLRKKGTYPSGTYHTFASKPTISSALQEGIKQGFIQHNIITHKYKATTDGKKYLKKFEIADFVLNSSYWDYYFSQNPTSKKPEVEVYTTTQGKESSDNILLFLNRRLERTKSADWKQWKKDIINYARAMNLLKENAVPIFSKLCSEEVIPESEVDFLKSELRNVWKEIFKGVERVTVVETLDPQLLLERIEQSLG